MSKDISSTDQNLLFNNNIMTFKRFTVEGDYMWCSKEFINFHYTIIQVVTSNYWTHSCDTLSLTDTDLLHNDVVVNSLPPGKILNSGGGSPPPTMKKNGAYELLFLELPEITSDTSSMHN